MRIGESGFVETPYWGSADIEEEISVKRIIPYDYGLKLEPIEFTVQLVLMDKYMRPKTWSPQERNKIARWLLKDRDRYKSFQTSDDLGKFYYVKCISVGELNLINTQGYLEVTFRTNSPYAWSPIYIENYDLSDNTTSRIIELENKSNILKYYRPKIEIELVGDTTSLQIKNLSNGGKIMKFEDLIPNEIISIDCENEIIKSNRPTSNPFSKFNVGMNYRYWCDLVYGVNKIEVSGKCIIRIKSQFPIAQ
jgi:phage-related protein